MLMILCPYCHSIRAEIEFRNVGAAHISRPNDPEATTDGQWGEFLYLRNNPKGRIAERWLHIHGCGRYFNAIRDTASDSFLTTYKSGEPRPETTPETSP